jgi:putative FmdB family regulatory protein
MIMYDWQCEYCNNKFEGLHKRRISIVTCPKCGGNSYKIFPTKAPSFNLTYNPKKDMCDWDGNQSQYYRSYNEAKERGEDVRLPEEGE